MTEPMASDERLRMRQSGRKMSSVATMIRKLLLVSRAGAPSSLPIEANESPTMIEYDTAPTNVLKVTAQAGMMALFSPNTLAHVSRYDSAPTAEPTRAIEEKE